MAFLNDEIAELLNVLRSAKAREIEGKRCFLMDKDQYYRALSLLRVWNPDMSFDSKLVASGYENIEIRVAQLDMKDYFIVCKDAHRIDTLWDGMPKK